MERINPQNTRLVHTLFMDFVGYSRLSTTAQAEVQTVLHELVARTEPYKIALSNHGLILRKTGDGMAIVFFDDPKIQEDVAYPVQCAIELDSAIKHQAVFLQKRVGANFRLRMGIHSGNVIVVSSAGEDDVAGDGINISQRVMDCGDEGHILVSSAVAQKIIDDGRWSSLLHDLGTCRVKHEELIHLFNLYGKHPDGTALGNEAIPHAIHENRTKASQRAEEASKQLIQDQKEVKKTFVWQAVAGVLGVTAIAGAYFWFKDVGEKDSYAKMAKRVSTKVQKIQQEKKIKKEEKTATEATPTAGATPDASPAASPAAISAVPNILGLTRAEAQKNALTMGLQLAESTKSPAQYNPTIPAGSVISQFPAAGGALPTDKQLYVVLSLGPQIATNATPTPALTQPQSIYTGVLIDASKVLTGNNPVALVGPQGQAILPSVASGSDIGQAAQAVGANPLTIVATGAGAQGVVLSDEALQALQNLPETVRSHAFVLTGTR
jgi:class 3 adenylate cyclase